jgi:hypothetical protein
MAQADEKGCSNAALMGRFAVVDNGFITVQAQAGPFADVGTLTFDGKGNTTGTAMASQNGNIFPLNMAGTYTVNSDCTGTFTLNVTIPIPGAPQLPPIHAYFVIDDNGKEFRSISTDSGRVVTTVGRVQFTAGSTAAR